MIKCSGKKQKLLASDDEITHTASEQLTISSKRREKNLLMVEKNA
jgi:hypothetical protein